MLVGGYKWYWQGDERVSFIYNDTTLVALEPEHNPVPDCLKTLGNFPFDTSEMHGGTDSGASRTILAESNSNFGSNCSQTVFHLYARGIVWMRKRADSSGWRTVTATPPRTTSGTMTETWNCLPHSNSNII